MLAQSRENIKGHVCELKLPVIIPRLGNKGSANSCGFFIVQEGVKDLHSLSWDLRRLSMDLPGPISIQTLVPSPGTFGAAATVCSPTEPHQACF